MRKKGFPAVWRVPGCIGILLLALQCPAGGCLAAAAPPAEDAASAPHAVYAEDDRLEPVSHETYPYSGGSTLRSGADGRSVRALKCYSEEEKSEISHARFDEQGRLLYVLGYSSNILGERSSYCEENIYERNDEEHSCRYFYYKSNSMPYREGYYVAYRYLFEVCDFQFDEEGRLLRSLAYRRNVGSDPNGYSDELFFARGYQADYDGDRLMEELQYYDYWGTNEVGAWEYRLCQYDEEDRCILETTVTEGEILLACYEYREDAGQADVYTYQVTEDWELSCEDGSVCELSPRHDRQAVRRVSADGTVEKELFYGKAMDLGQQHYLMPESVEETMEDHRYTVRLGDSLWKIAAECYGHGAYSDLIHRMNMSIIGPDGDLILPGMRLYLPEAGSAEDTRIKQ